MAAYTFFIGLLVSKSKILRSLTMKFRAAGATDSFVGVEEQDSKAFMMKLRNNCFCGNCWTTSSVFQPFAR